MTAVRAIPFAVRRAAWLVLHAAVAKGALLTTPDTFLFNVGEAIVYTVVIALIVFLYAMVLMAPFVILYQIMNFLVKRFRRAPGNPGRRP